MSTRSFDPNTAPRPERDPRFERLLFLADGVFAIALTLLAVELVLPEATADLHGRALLDSLLESWPRVLAFLTSFTFIANFWVGHNMMFHHIRRFDGGLMWHPVAQQFYFGTVLLTGLVMWALWWYMSAGNRLVDRNLSPRDIRRTHLISLGVPLSMLLLMILVAVGVGRFINPLLLGYIVTFGYTVLGVLEGRKPAPTEVPEEQEQPEGQDPESVPERERPAPKAQ